MEMEVGGKQTLSNKKAKKFEKKAAAGVIVHPDQVLIFLKIFFFDHYLASSVHAPRNSGKASEYLLPERYKCID